MNKLISLLLVLSLLFTFTACGSNDADLNTSDATGVSQSTSNSKIPYQETTSQTEVETTTDIPSTVVTTDNVVSTTASLADIPIVDDSVDENDLESQIVTDPLGSFQRAVSRIIDDGVAGFSKKTWQDLYSTEIYSDNDKTNSIIDSIETTLVDLMTGFFTAEEDAVYHTYQKGNSYVKDMLPRSNCSPEYIASFACIKEGSRYRITIIMNPQTNPSRSDTDGLNAMSKDLIYMDELEHEFTDAASTNSMLREFKEGLITYNAYVIEAVMSWDHKLISITHYCDVDMYVAVNAMYTEDLYMKSSFSTNTVYQGFIY